VAKKQRELPRIVAVRIGEAAPNKLFTENTRLAVRFLHYSAPVPCAECGRWRRHHWTMLVSFQALSMGPLVLTASGKIHMPLTPVCGTHVLADPDHKPGTSSTLVLDRKGGAAIA
jgi:hypothetical protein